MQGFICFVYLCLLELFNIFIEPFHNPIGYCLGVVFNIFVKVVQIILTCHKSHLYNHACHIRVTDHRVIVVTVSLGSNPHTSAVGYANFLKVSQECRLPPRNCVPNLNYVSISLSPLWYWLLRLNCGVGIRIGPLSPCLL